MVIDIPRFCVALISKFFVVDACDGFLEEDVPVHHDFGIRDFNYNMCISLLILIRMRSAMHETIRRKIMLLTFCGFY